MKHVYSKMKTQSARALNIFIRDRYSEFLKKRPIGHFAHMEKTFCIYSRPKSKVSDSPKTYRSIKKIQLFTTMPDFHCIIQTMFKSWLYKKREPDFNGTTSQSIADQRDSSHWLMKMLNKLNTAKSYCLKYNQNVPLLTVYIIDIIWTNGGQFLKVVD